MTPGSGSGPYGLPPRAFNNPVGVTLELLGKPAVHRKEIGNVS